MRVVSTRVATAVGSLVSNVMVVFVGDVSIILKRKTSDRLFQFVALTCEVDKIISV